MLHSFEIVVLGKLDADARRRPVTGENGGVLVERDGPGSDGLEFEFGVAAVEIGPADRAREQRVAREEARTVLVLEEERARARRVARSVNHLDPRFAERNDRAALEGPVGGQRRLSLAQVDA